MPTRHAPILILCAAAAMAAGATALFWPGIVTYDGARQFEQAVSGIYDDWHPPILAHLWSVLHAIFGGGTAPMLVAQMALYWLGFGLIGAALAMMGRVRAGAAVLAIGALPLFLGWQGVVLKDTQMLAALLAGVGLIGWWRLRGARPPLAALAVAVVLIGYATLVRANAVFATAPLFVLLIGPRGWTLRFALIAIGSLAVLALAPLLNHGVLGAGRSGVERTEAIYDLAGIAVRAPDTPVGLSRETILEIAARHCVKPLFWDPLGSPTRCDALVNPLRERAPGELYGVLARAIAAAPIAYAGHRLAHLNSTERWLVARQWPFATPPHASIANPDALGSPGAGAVVWLRAAEWMAKTPLGWPIVWLVVAVAGVGAVLGRARGPMADMALALFGSAIALEASFAFISIASDLRYHLWPMVASALAAVLLASDRAWTRRALMFGGAVLAVVLIGGAIARLSLPVPPGTYEALLL